MKIAILIPAHNASRTIGGIVTQVKALGFAVIVVDDGSTDDTFEIAGNSGAVVLKNEKNQGKGAALRSGFKYILAGDYDGVITMDADGQHEPASLADFAGKAESADSAFIVGDRMSQTAGMPRIRVITNRFMSFLLSKKIGQYVPDTQCGYRFIKRDLLAKLCLFTSRYEIESEMLIQAARLGVRIDSVAIKSIYAGQSSRINPFIDTLRFIRLMLKN